MNKPLRSILTVAIATTVFGLTLPAYAHADEGNAAQSVSTNQVVNTKAALRDLWVDHVFWIRNVVLETASGNKEAAKAAEGEVVANAKAIANSIEPFYGKDASTKLFDLLAGHYGAVKSYLAASSTNNKAKQDAAVSSLTANAEEIAVFLSSANPNLPKDTLQSLLMAHGGHHVQEINQLRDKQYAQEAKTWAQMKSHVYVISDALVDALYKQFPAKF